MNVTEEDVKKAVAQSNIDQLKTFEKGVWIEALEWVLANCSGGGNWRRKCMMKIDRLRGDAPDPTPGYCRDRDCPMHTGGAVHKKSTSYCKYNV